MTGYLDPVKVEKDEKLKWKGDLKGVEKKE